MDRYHVINFICFYILPMIVSWIAIRMVFIDKYALSSKDIFLGLFTTFTPGINLLTSLIFLVSVIDNDSNSVLATKIGYKIFAIKKEIFKERKD